MGDHSIACQLTMLCFPAHVSLSGRLLLSAAEGAEAMPWTGGSSDFRSKPLMRSCSPGKGGPRAPHLDGGRDKEVLLLQAQLFALVGAVVWVQDRRQRFRALPREDGLRQQRSTPHCLPSESLAGASLLQEEAAHRGSLCNGLHSSNASDAEGDTVHIYTSAEGLQEAQKCPSDCGISTDPW